jgi:hypothetical protein
MLSVDAGVDLGLSFRLMSFWLTIALYGAAASPAADCDCGRVQRVEEELRKADAVFLGEAVAPEGGVVTEAWDWLRGVRRQRFRVEQAFKGSTEERIVIETSSDGCAYTFEPGSRYLVYAFAVDETTPGGLQTSLCSRTKPLGQAETDDLLVLRENIRCPSGRSRGTETIVS